MDVLAQFQLLDDQWSLFSVVKQYYFQIGVYKICLSFVTDTLAEKITRAFDHIKINSVEKPDLTICLWDVSASLQKLPNLDWELISFYGYKGYSKDNVYVQFFEEIRALSVINLNENKAYYVVRDAELLPWWVSGSPLQVILHIWLAAHELRLTHAAAVGDANSAVLFSGKGGSGKSTTTLACLRFGLNYISEDYGVLELTNKPVIHTVYQTAKWELNTRKLFPSYEKHIVNPFEADAEKALVYYQDFFPEQIKSALPISAIVSLKVGKDEYPVLKKQEEALALKDLLLSTVKQLPLAHENTISQLKGIVSRIKCYQLLLGKNTEENVKTIRALL